MSSPVLVGDKERKTRVDGRILPVSSKVYKLKDKGEGSVRIVLTAPVEALADFATLLEWLENRAQTQVPLLNTTRVATQKARERCAKDLPRKFIAELNDKLYLLKHEVAL